MAHLSPLLKQATPVLVERGEGVRVFDESGRGYLDFTAGIGVTSTGHCHPRVVAAAQAASSAARASSGVASATSQRLSPVAGSSTASVAEAVASRHSPPMKSCLGTASTTDASSVRVIVLMPKA